MRQTQIFSGSSHPQLVNNICERLGLQPANAELRKFSNGETSVQIQTSVRNQDVFIIHCGSSKMNDSVMELLIMISACKGGSARSITAVLPYFPYGRHAKKKSHRGCITARMLASLMHVAGVNHVITVDLHASQMQGFFKCPMDNLVAEPLLARWVRMHVRNWQEAVVVSKNPGGTKRATSLADALDLGFGVITTDHRRILTSASQSMSASLVLTRDQNPAPSSDRVSAESSDSQGNDSASAAAGVPGLAEHGHGPTSHPFSRARMRTFPTDGPDSSPPTTSSGVARVNSAPVIGDETSNKDYEDGDERARDVYHGRFKQGHIIADGEYPSVSASVSSLPAYGQQQQQQQTAIGSDDATPDTPGSRYDGARPGGADDGASSDDDDNFLANPEVETTVTLIGSVRGRPVLIMDDMIDKPDSWIAAAETVVKRAGATEVYCLATHGLFGGDCLAELESCESINAVVVTNTFPVPTDKIESTSKLHVVDISSVVSEAIRRNHHGESLAQLYLHLDQVSL